MLSVVFYDYNVMLCYVFHKTQSYFSGGFGVMLYGFIWPHVIMARTHFDGVYNELMFTACIFKAHRLSQTFYGQGRNPVIKGVEQFYYFTIVRRAYKYTVKLNVEIKKGFYIICGVNYQLHLSESFLHEVNTASVFIRIFIIGEIKGTKPFNRCSNLIGIPDILNRENMQAESLAGDNVYIFSLT